MDRISRVGTSLSIGLTICALGLLLAGCGITISPPERPATGVFVFTMTRPSGAQPGPAYTTLTFVASDTGKVRWQHREEWTPFIPQRNADGPVVADGVVYMVGDTNTTSTDFAQHPPSGMLLALRASDGQQLWRNDVGAFASQPVVDGDTIYITAHHVVKNSGLSKTVYALNRGDGSVRWKTEITDTRTLTDALKVSHGRLFLSASQFCFDYCSAAYLFALDTANGHIVWQHSYEGNVTILPPLVDGNAVYARILGSDVGLHALSTADGHQLWQAPADSLISSGQDYLARGGMVYTDKVIEWAEAAHFTPLKYAIVARDGMTGAPRWQTPTDLYPMVLAVEGDRVIIRSEAHNPHASRTTSQYLDVISALRVSDGKRLWSVQHDAYGGNAASAGATIYTTLPPPTLPPTPTHGGQQAIAALRTADGSVLWHQSVKTADPSSGSSANNLGIVYPVGNLLCIFSGGILYGMHTSDGHTLWSANLSSSGDIQGATIVS